MKKSFLGIIALTAGLYFATTARASNDGCVISGPNNAPLTIEEYSDFECPYCAKGAEIMKQVLSDYKGKVRLVLRNMPLPFHKNALPAAKAFVAVWMQKPEVAYDYQDKLFTNQGRLESEGEKFLISAAQDLRIDTAQMKTDMAGDQVAKVLAEDEALAKKYGFRGTPSFRIGSETLVGSRPYGDFKEVIDRQLAP